MGASNATTNFQYFAIDLVRRVRRVSQRANQWLEKYSTRLNLSTYNPRIDTLRRCQSLSISLNQISQLYNELTLRGSGDLFFMFEIQPSQTQRLDQYPRL